jgi:hypothetical protein
VKGARFCFTLPSRQGFVDHFPRALFANELFDTLIRRRMKEARTVYAHVRANLIERDASKKVTMEKSASHDLGASNEPSPSTIRVQFLMLAISLAKMLRSANSHYRMNEPQYALIYNPVNGTLLNVVHLVPQ